MTTSASGQVVSDKSSLVSPQSKPRFYRPELDVLRFLAFLLVYIRHVVPSDRSLFGAIGAAGQSGVCLFFLLSAYLITVLLDREAELTGKIDLRQFYIRRILRIWPLYFAALLLAWVLDIHSATPQMSTGRMIASLLLVGNWYTFWYGLPASFALVLWSISVEEQFYLVWPSIRRFFGRRALMIASVATLPLSYFAIFWLCRRTHASDIQIWVNTFVQAQFFGLGAWLALVVRDRSPRLRLPLRAALFASGLFCFFASEYFFHGATNHPFAIDALREYLMMTLGSLLLFFSALGFAELRNASWLIYLGKISYGLYVFHILAYHIAKRPIDWLSSRAIVSPPVTASIHFILGLGLTVVMAHFSYRYFEAIFLRIKMRFSPVKSRSI